MIIITDLYCIMTLTNHNENDPRKQEKNMVHPVWL